MKLRSKVVGVLLMGSLFLSGCQSQVNTGKDTKVNNTNTSITEVEDVKKIAGDNAKKPIEEEPRYEDTIKLGYSGDLCLGGPNLASLDIVFSSASHTGCKSLYVLNESEITKTKELEGKNLAITNGIGNSNHNTALRFFNHDGVDPDKVSYKQVDNAAVIQAMKDGEIDSAVLDDQFAKSFVDKGVIRPIRSMTDDEDFGNEVCCVLAFNGTFAKENPLIADEVASAIQEANDYIENNPEEATKKLYDNNLASGDFEAGLDLMKSYDYSVKNELAEKTLESIFTDYKKIGLIEDDRSVEDLMKSYWLPLVGSFYDEK